MLQYSLYTIIIMDITVVFFQSFGLVQCNIFSLRQLSKYTNTVYGRLTSGPALETGRRELIDSIPGRACRVSLSELFVAFSETRVSTG